MTSFTSLSFLFRFLPIIIAAYYLVPTKYRNSVLLLGSIVFYAVGEPVYVLLLIGLTVFNYLFAVISFRDPANGSVIEKTKNINSSMLIAVISDIFILVLFKALSVFSQNIMLPLGLSFYIFKMISFQMDICRRRLSAPPSFINVSTYFCCFTQVEQGPIMRYEDGDFESSRKFDWENLEEGLRLFICGFGMKVILADRIGILWNDLGMYGYESISTPLAWLGAFAYSFELYFDFWGYSLMASGLMVALGFNHIINFDNPYASTTISEFYRRWHVTLGAFFRDYVYFPMGGSRCDKKRMCFNLMVVWLLTGIWHGNGVNYLIWGIILGLFIVAEKLWIGQKLNNIKALGHIYVIFVIPLTWVVFAITSVKDIGIFFSRLFPFFNNAVDITNNLNILEYIKDYGLLFIFAIILCIPQVIDFLKKHSKHIVTNVLLIIVFWIAIYYSASSAGNPFMYLNF